VVLLAEGTLVDAAALRRFMPERERAAALSPMAPPPGDAAPLVRDYQSAQSHSAQALREALERHQGNQTRAAQSLGLTLRQFSYRLRKAQLR